MFKTNEYFDGKVKSIAFNTLDCPATIGVMAAGEYEFSTSSIEHMTVVSGKLIAKLPDTEDWKIYSARETFVVEKDKKFQLIVKEESAYFCLYK